VKTAGHLDWPPIRERENEGDGKKYKIPHSTEIGSWFREWAESSEGRDGAAGTPMAAMMMSARRVWAAMSLVPVWHAGRHPGGGDVGYKNRRPNY